MGREATIMIADDAPEIRAVVAEMIEPLGAEVVQAADGREAFRILKERPVDVVLSDLIMPRMSGMMLLHSMLEEGLQIPFILMSGFSDKDSAIQALRLGAFDYLEKPLHESDLCSILEEALRVGSRQQRLAQLVQAQAPGVDAAAPRQIVKMRALTYKDDAAEALGARQATANTWDELKDLFLQEAEPQLVFAEASLRGLLRSENRERDLAYVLKVLRTLRLAAEAARMGDIAHLAWVVECAVASCCSLADQLQAEDTELLVTANRLLRERIAALDDSHSRSLVKRLEHLALRFFDKKRD